MAFRSKLRFPQNISAFLFFRVTSLDFLYQGLLRSKPEKEPFPLQLIPFVICRSLRPMKIAAPQLIDEESLESLGSAARAAAVNSQVA